MLSTSSIRGSGVSWGQEKTLCSVTQFCVRLGFKLGRFKRFGGSEPCNHDFIHKWNRSNKSVGLVSPSQTTPDFRQVLGLLPGDAGLNSQCSEEPLLPLVKVSVCTSERKPEAVIQGAAI